MTDQGGLSAEESAMRSKLTYASKYGLRTTFLGREVETLVVALDAARTDHDRLQSEITTRDLMWHERVTAAERERDRLREALEDALAYETGECTHACNHPSCWGRQGARALLVEQRAKAEPEPKKMLLFCPRCNRQHYDRGEWATRPHHKHLCAHCGTVWDAGVLSYGVSAGELPEAAGGTDAK